MDDILQQTEQVNSGINEGQVFIMYVTPFFAAQHGNNNLTRVVIQLLDTNCLKYDTVSRNKYGDKYKMPSLRCRIPQL